MKVSFLEIYLEKLRDLLSDSLSIEDSNRNKRSNKKVVHKSRKAKQKEKESKKLRIRTLPNGSTMIQNLVSVEVDSLMEVLGLIQKTSMLRTTSATNMNAHSSRSHFLMLVEVQQKMANGSTKISKLNFADLAGSEKVKKTGASGIRMSEAQSINKSLSHLGSVIRALAEVLYPFISHVP